MAGTHILSGFFKTIVDVRSEMLAAVHPFEKYLPQSDASSSGFFVCVCLERHSKADSSVHYPCMFVFIGNLGPSSNKVFSKTVVDVSITFYPVD